MKKPGRMIIETKDVMRITGLTERTARRRLASIRLRFNKRKKAPVSIEEFCSYMQLSEPDVLKFLF